MDGGDTPEARLPSRDSVVLDVWFYYYSYVVNVASVKLCTCGVAYIWCVYRLFMQCYV